MLADKALELVSDKADALLVHNIYNIRYISGFTNDTAVLYISPLRRVLMTDSRYTTQAKLEAKDFEIVDVGQLGYSKIISKLAKLDGVTHIAFEADRLSVKEYLKYDHEVSAEFVAIDKEIDSLRMIKTEEELGLLAKAEEIGDLGFSEIIKLIRPGMTELEVAARLEFILKSNGAEGLSFDTIVASGVNSSMPHAIPSSKKIEIGDFVTMDFGCIYKGYCSDMTRTIVVGNASDRQREIYNTVLKAQTTVCEKIKAGMVCRDVDTIARTIIYEAGYEGCFGHGLGHSVGLYIHENPACNTRTYTVLQENMIMTVEPGIYIEGFGGVRIEDMVCVKNNGCLNFTHSPKQLIEII